MKVLHWKQAGWSEWFRTFSHPALTWLYGFETSSRRISNEKTEDMQRSTHIDLVQRDAQRLCKALFRLRIGLVLLLVVVFENIVLLLGQSWFHVDSKTGKMVGICSVMLVIEVRLCVVMIGKWIRLSAEMWIAEIDVVIVVCICGKCVKLHGEKGCVESECCWCEAAEYRNILPLSFNPSPDAAPLVQ